VPNVRAKTNCQKKNFKLKKIAPSGKRKYDKSLKKLNIFKLTHRRYLNRSKVTLRQCCRNVTTITKLSFKKKGKKRCQVCAKTNLDKKYKKI